MNPIPAMIDIACDRYDIADPHASIIASHVSFNAVHNDDDDRTLVDDSNYGIVALVDTGHDNSASHGTTGKESQAQCQ